MGEIGVSLGIFNHSFNSLTVLINSIASRATRVDQTQTKVANFDIN